MPGPARDGASQGRPEAPFRIAGAASLVEWPEEVVAEDAEEGGGEGEPGERGSRTTAIASAGPVVWIMPNRPTAIDESPTMTVAALAVMTAPMRLPIPAQLRGHASWPSSSRKREIRKIV